MCLGEEDGARGGGSKPWLVVHQAGWGGVEVGVHGWRATDVLGQVTVWYGGEDPHKASSRQDP